MMNATRNNSINSTELFPTNFPIITEESIALREIPWLCVKVVILLFGALGNAVVCCIMVRRLKNRGISAINVYVLNLALADLGVLLLISPNSLAQSHTSINWPFGRFYCLYINPFTETFYGTSVWMIAAIAIDRYLEIVHMFSYKHSFPINRVISTVVALSWLGSFLIVALPVYIFIKFHKEPTISYCYMDYTKTQEEVYFSILLSLTYFLPLCVITFTYYKVWISVQRNSDFHRSMHRSSSHSHSNNLVRPESFLNLLKQLKHNAKVKRILTPVVVAFAVTMFPLNLLRLLVIIDPKSIQDFNLFVHFIEVFTMINSAINPFIYSVVSREFRSDTKALLHSVCQRNRSETVSLTTFTMTRSNELLGRSRSPSNLSKTHELVPETNV